MITVPKLNLYMKLVYFGHKTNECKNELNQLISKFYPQVKLNVLLSNNNTIQIVFSL